MRYLYISIASALSIAALMSASLYFSGYYFLYKRNQERFFVREGDLLISVDKYPAENGGKIVIMETCFYWDGMKSQKKISFGNLQGSCPFIFKPRRS